MVLSIVDRHPHACVHKLPWNNGNFLNKFSEPLSTKTCCARGTRMNRVHLRRRSKTESFKIHDVIDHTPFAYEKHRNFESGVRALRCHCSSLFLFVELAKNIKALVEHKRRITCRAIFLILCKLKSPSPGTPLESNARTRGPASTPRTLFHGQTRCLRQRAREVPCRGWTSSLELCCLHSQSASDKDRMFR